MSDRTPAPIHVLSDGPAAAAIAALLDGNCRAAVEALAAVDADQLDRVESAAQHLSLMAHRMRTDLA